LGRGDSIFFSIEGDCLSLREDNSERVKEIEFLKEIFLEPLDIIQSNLVQIILG
jgi:hypothetical protein